MKVISINEKNKDLELEKAQQMKADMLDVLDVMKEMVEAGEIKEFVAASLDENGEVQIHANIRDFAGGVGLFEIGKVLLMEQQNFM